MGWLNRALGFPDPNASGSDRAFFQKTGSLAVDQFFNHRNYDRCVSFIAAGTDKVIRKFGEGHPDEKRFQLLSAIILMLTGQDDSARTLAAIANHGLASLGASDFDRRAAEDFVEKLDTLPEWDGVASQEFMDARMALLDEDSPIGAFLFNLIKAK
jgi:hypothetical protein